MGAVSVGCCRAAEVEEHRRAWVVEAQEPFREGAECGALRDRGG